MKKITELTAELAAPAIAEQGCTLWDVEYVKEAGTWYLRILIDKEGGVDILDCEAVSRKVSDLLDEVEHGGAVFFAEGEEVLHDLDEGLAEVAALGEGADVIVAGLREHIAGTFAQPALGDAERRADQADVRICDGMTVLL